MSFFRNVLVRYIARHLMPNNREKIVASIYFWANEECAIHYMKIFSFKKGSRSNFVCNIDEYVGIFYLILTILLILGKG